jgi:acetate kinase
MRPPEILVINPGSSSLKAARYTGLERIDSSNQPLSGGWRSEIASAVARLISESAVAIDAVAYRVVHGGDRYCRPTPVDGSVLEALEATVPLAPLHQPPALEAMRAGLEAAPNALHVACFDTAFHATLLESEKRFAIPTEFHRAGLRRYGFHGLSYESIAQSLPEVSGRAARGRTVVCHLGNGSSLCGMVDRVSRTTSMGFTPLDGLIMGTRCGRIDAGILIHWMRQGMGADEVEAILTQRSGLLGLSERTGDMRVLEQQAPRDIHCEQALDQYCLCVAREIASAATVLGGLDAIVFTAGIGENSQEVRARVAAHLSWLGARLAEGPQGESGPRLHASDSRVEILCIPTDEQRIISQHTWELLRRSGT